MTNPGSDFWLGGLRRPGETQRNFWFPKNHCFRLHAHDSMVKLPANDESGFRFWVGGNQETRRDFGFPKNHAFGLHAHDYIMQLHENDESGFRFWVVGTQETRRDPERFWGPKKPLF
jgi:hypothetical protein